MKLKKNEVIIDDVSFYLHNINGNGVNIYVHAYAQDVTEYDTYTADIYIVNEFHETEKLHSTLHFDSCGNINEEQSMLDEIENAVLDVLFINRQYGIIRGF